MRIEVWMLGPVLLALGAVGFWFWKRSRRNQSKKLEKILNNRHAHTPRPAPVRSKPEVAIKVPPVGFSSASLKEEDPLQHLQRTMRAHAMAIQQAEMAKLTDWKWGIVAPAMVSFVWRQTVANNKAPVRIPYIGNIGAAEAWLHAITQRSRYVVRVEVFDPLDTEGMVKDYLAFLKLLQEGGDRAKPWVHGGANYSLYSMAYMMATGQEAAQLGDGTISNMGKDTRVSLPSFNDIVGDQELNTDQFDEPVEEGPSSSVIVEPDPLLAQQEATDPHAETEAPATVEVEVGGTVAMTPEAQAALTAAKARGAAGEEDVPPLSPPPVAQVAAGVDPEGQRPTRSTLAWHGGSSTNNGRTGGGVDV